MALKLWALKNISYISYVITIKQTTTMAILKTSYSLMSNQELHEQLSELENDIYQGSFGYDELKVAKRKVRKFKKAIIALLPPLVPGCTISLSDYITHLNVKELKSDKPKKMFMDDSRYNGLDDNDMSIIEDMFGDNYGVYNHFNRNYPPTDVKRIKGATVKQECKSNNIYDVMSTPQHTDFRDEFQIKLSYHSEPVTVYKEYNKNTTLSRRDVVNFM
jgi:hypothetical protein